MMLPLSAVASRCAYAVDIFYPAGLATLTAEQKEGLIDAIRRTEQAGRILGIHVVGHADRSEGLTRTQEADLSLRRARSIRDFVNRVRPDLAPLTYVEGKGALQPVAQPGDEKNRRVELEVVCPSRWQPWGTK